MPPVDPIVLGIDPGSHNTGYGLVTQEGSRLIHLQSGTIQAPSKASLEKRLRFLYEELIRVIRRSTPSVMSIEAVFYAKNVRSVVALAHARGVALLAAAQMNLPVAEYSPLEVKQSTVGYGRATKEQVAAMMSRLFHLPSEGTPLGTDRTDALAVALCHLNISQTRNRLRLTDTDLSLRPRSTKNYRWKSL